LISKVQDIPATGTSLAQATVEGLSRRIFSSGERPWDLLVHDERFFRRVLKRISAERVPYGRLVDCDAPMRCAAVHSVRGSINGYLNFRHDAGSFDVASAESSESRPARVSGTPLRRR
jgi:hypothetical protein